MRCPTLKELPSPPKGKTGWPWTEESLQLPDTTSNDRPWPKISIVTPSFNQGEFVEEAIRSVLLQGYPNLEYIIIDGGSTDNSVEIIKKYEHWIKYWSSVSDEGVYYAINEGFRHAKGKYLAWINSDDIYLPNALKYIGCAINNYPGYVAYVGGGHMMNSDLTQIRNIKIPTDEKFREFLKYYFNWYKDHFYQPSCFFKKSAFDEVKGLNTIYKYAADFRLWLDLQQLGEFKAVNNIISYYRVHPKSYTGISIPTMILDIFKVCRDYDFKIAVSGQLDFIYTQQCNIINKIEDMKKRIQTIHHPSLLSKIKFNFLKIIKKLLKR